MSVAQVSPEVAQKVASPRLPEVVESVTCYGHGLGIYLWPLFVVPLLMGGLVQLGAIDGKTAVWSVMIAYMIVISAMSFNMSRSASALFIAAVVIVVLCIYAAGQELHVPLFSYIGDFLRRIPFGWTAEVQSFVYFLSAVMAFLFVWELIDSRADSRWVLSKNEFEHFSWGRKDVGYKNNQFSLTTSTQDLLKYLLAFGGARIEITNSETRHVESTIDNVVCGVRAGSRIRKMLLSTLVVQVSH